MTLRKKILAGIAGLTLGGAALAIVFRAALLLFVFGLIIRPRMDFDPAAAPAPPDYTQISAWAAHPDSGDASDWTPKDLVEPENPLKDKVAVFYIHPTGFFGRGNWNARIDARSTPGIPVEAMLVSQASAFNGCGRVYAPKYRQATLYSFFEPSRAPEKKNGYQALELAYSDVARAFDHFIEHECQGRPFIVAGHSQGAQHAMRLIAERIDQTPLYERLIAAYAIGYSMPEDLFTRVYTNVKPCTSPAQTGCVIHWDTFKEGSTPENLGFHYYPGGWESAAGKKRYCVNPLTWTSETTRAPASLNSGALIVNAEGEIGAASMLKLSAEHTWAECHDGVLWVKDQAGTPFAGRLALEGSYHVHDYNLFWMNIRQNAAVRAKAWLENRPGA
ncbi:MAG: DUF3089 domain-containing protein [Candidatus Hydrogenedentes bacterium]|nr:DUF3089 domain-containing protein [Candidatus Hydrogenedentota bacterium]